MRKKVVFIALGLAQPRIIKRIIAFKEAGYEVKVYGYSRGFYTCNMLPSDISVTLLGKQRDGAEYFSKFKQMKNDAKSILHSEGCENVLYYCFSYVPAFYMWKYKAKYVYEISDLTYSYKQFAIVCPILKFFDKRMIRGSVMTVIVCKGISEYFFGEKNLSNIVIQPNKLNSCFNNMERIISKKQDASHLTFAYAGAIRHPNTFLRFAKIIGEYYPCHKFVFYGDSALVPSFKEQTKQYTNVEFKGAFRNPEDLQLIYSNVDIVVACYETESFNDRIADANKMYEALFFGKPIVASKNTFLASQVEKYDYGFVINAYSNKEIRSLIDSLTLDDINRIIENEKQIDKKQLIDNPNHIIEAVKQLYSN